METIFSKIIRKEIPAKIVYEDDLCLAFHDIQPRAPVHVLLIPKTPIVGMNTVTEKDKEILGHLMAKVPEIAELCRLKEFRLVSNAGKGVGQSVFHLNFHIMGGRPMGWPPG